MPTLTKPRFESKFVPADKRSDWLKTARDRHSFAEAIDRDDKKLALSDAEFALAEPYGDTGGTTQWDKGAAQARKELKRPCLTENRLLTFTAQVVNDGRQSKPAIKITAMDGGTKETAEYFQGRIRQIEYDCQADIAYDSAREQQVTCGRGFLRVNWDYEYKSFKRRIRLQRIENQFSVLFGPAREYDCSDADYCFVVNAITRDEHVRKYGEETTVAHTNFASTENPAPGWIGIGTNGEMVQEAEYWTKEYTEKTLCLLSDGRVLFQEEVPENYEALGLTIDEERPEKDYRVVQYIIDGADILGETEFPGPYIPIVPQWGREYFLDGKRRTISLIRNAKDPQRLLNLYVSNIAEQIGQMPKTPWWVAVGSIPAGAQQVYDGLNDKPHQYVPFNSYEPDGERRQLPQPHRDTNEPPIVALVAGYNQCVDAIKASMGIYDASLGNRSNETSGIAIQGRQRQSDNANFHFHDNEARTRNHVGRIMLRLIREMDKGVGERPVRSEEGKTKLVKVGVKFRDPETKKVVLHDLSTGNYGNAVETGPGYVGERQAAFDLLTKMAAQWPALLQVGGPTILRMSDIPSSNQLADLMEKTLPPELRSEKPGEDGQPTIPPEVQQKFQQIQQQASEVIDGLTSRVKELEQQLAGRQMEQDTRLQIAAMQANTQMLIESAKLGQKEGLTLLTSELETIHKKLDLMDAERARQHQAQQAKAAQDAQAASQQADQQHQQAMPAIQAAAQPQEAPGAPEAAAEPTQPTE